MDSGVPHEDREVEGEPVISVPGTALLTCVEGGVLEGVSSEGGGVEPGRQQSFDVGERLGLGQFGEHVAQVGVGLECVGPPLSRGRVSSQKRVSAFHCTGCGGSAWSCPGGGGQHLGAGGVGPSTQHVEHWDGLGMSGRRSWSGGLSRMRRSMA